MQRIDEFATFKVEAVRDLRMPSTQLVLSAQPQERETLIPVASWTWDTANSGVHAARFDAALSTTSTRGQRAILFLAVALILLGAFLSLYLNWRMQ
jgi:hypothetical protein